MLGLINISPEVLWFLLLSDHEDNIISFDNFFVILLKFSGTVKYHIAWRIFLLALDELNVILVNLAEEYWYSTQRDKQQTEAFGPRPFQ